MAAETARAAAASANTEAAPAPRVKTIAEPSRNVYMSGSSVHPGSPVEGDFLALGGRIVLDQEIKGDVMAMGGSIDVRAPVGDDVRLLAGDVRIETSIGGELNVSAGNIQLTKAAHVRQLAKLNGGKVLIEGRIDGPLRVNAQEIILNAEVNGDTSLNAKTIELGPLAKLAGSLDYSAPQELSRAAGATIAGAVTREQAGDGQRNGRDRRLDKRSGDADWERNGEHNWERHMDWRGPSWMAHIFAFLALLACAAVLLLVFPGFSSRAAAAVGDSAGLALAIGFGSLVGLPILALLLCITILGIPLGLTLLALYPVVLLTGYLVGVLFLAWRAKQQLFPALSDRPEQAFAMSIALFSAALLLVMLVSHLPFVGGLALFIITVLGAGACVLELYRSRQSGPPAPKQESGREREYSDIAHSTG
ncbi:bactofilin family protein [Roseateles oligotrophus]|uniref:DUF8173 domain-containing protein n=1 Tax=Roseateles oligotrophus TaxID=1769250 RepID=A0ABT2YLK2_9BURK|nr:hypothetical protein [Roseateles oligotrophus]MCV2370943.1 hypothetical protein [Roseateles oligotrophus]